jgi:hypothetical protein
MSMPTLIIMKNRTPLDHQAEARISNPGQPVEGKTLDYTISAKLWPPKCKIRCLELKNEE